MTPKQNLLVILLSCLIAISILYLVLYAILSKSLRQQQAADEKRKAYEMPELRNNRQNESSSSIQVLDNQQRKDMKNQAENALMSHRGGKPNTSPAPPPQIAVQDNRMSDLIKLESEGEIVQGQVIASGTGNSNNNVLAGLIPTPKVETNKADDLAAQPRQGLPNPFASPTNGGEQTIENAVRKYEGEVTKKAFVPEQKIAGIESAVNLDDDEEDDNIKNKALNE